MILVLGIGNLAKLKGDFLNKHNDIQGVSVKIFHLNMYLVWNFVKMSERFKL